MAAHLPSLSPFKGKFGGPNGTALLLTPSTETIGDRVTSKLCWAATIAGAWLLSSSPAIKFPKFLLMLKTLIKTLRQQAQKMCDSL